WVNFAMPDKYIEVQLAPDGHGMILFQIVAWGERYITGGKLIGIDLNQLGIGEPVFTEGGVLKADAAWLKRVFSNPEINRIHTFANAKLGVFAANARAIGEPKQLME